MILKSKLATLLLSALALCSPSLSYSAITIYNNQAAFIAATVNQATDTFAGLSVTGSTPSPIVRAAGPYVYTASATSGVFFASGTPANPSLSPNAADDTITLSAFAGGVTAVGGNFFATDILGVFQVGNISLSATDASGTLFQTIVNASNSSFLGFVSTGALSSLTFQSVQPLNQGFVWGSADNLIFASTASPVSPIPEPEVYATMMMGVGLVGFLARRRKTSKK
jgi:PEP-CTERM motif